MILRGPSSIVSTYQDGDFTPPSDQGGSNQPNRHKIDTFKIRIGDF